MTAYHCNGNSSNFLILNCLGWSALEVKLLWQFFSHPGCPECVVLDVILVLIGVVTTLIVCVRVRDNSLHIPVVDLCLCWKVGTYSFKHWESCSR